MIDEERRGGRARECLGNEVYKEAWERIERHIVNEIARVDATAEQRDRLGIRLSLMRQQKTYLEQVMLTGQMAAMEEQRKRTLKERMRAVFPA